MVQSKPRIEGVFLCMEREWTLGTWGHFHYLKCFFGQKRKLDVTFCMVWWASSLLQFHFEWFLVVRAMEVERIIILFCSFLPCLSKRINILFILFFLLIKDDKQSYEVFESEILPILYFESYSLVPSTVSKHPKRTLFGR